MEKSNYLRLNWRDAFRGFVVAVITVVIMGAMTSLQAGELPDMATLKTLLLTGLGSGCAYLIKNIFSSSTGEMLTKEIKHDNYENHI